jgi:hypothetical protein
MGFNGATVLFDALLIAQGLIVAAIAMSERSGR